VQDACKVACYSCQSHRIFSDVIAASHKQYSRVFFDVLMCVLYCGAAEDATLSRHSGIDIEQLSLQSRLSTNHSGEVSDHWSDWFAECCVYTELFTGNGFCDVLSLCRQTFLISYIVCFIICPISIYYATKMTTVDSWECCSLDAEPNKLRQLYSTSSATSALQLLELNDF